MDNLVSNIEALNQKFKNSAKADLDNIEESSALLNGGTSNVTNKVKTAEKYGKYIGKFDSRSRFEYL